MIKVRLTFIEDKDGQEDLRKMIQDLKENYIVLNESRVYKGRNGSRYSNIYLDIDKKK